MLCNYLDNFINEADMSNRVPLLNKNLLQMLNLQTAERTKNTVSDIKYVYYPSADNGHIYFNVLMLTPADSIV